MSTPPATIWFYRILHIDNLKFVLSRGIYSANRPDKNPNYKFIGDTGLTAQRQAYPIPLIGNYGSLGDYVPFYLGPRSPMLYTIVHGYRGTHKVPEDQIVYIGCRMSDLIAGNAEVLLTDGHAKQSTTTFFLSTEDLSQIDWEAASAKIWRNTEADWDLQRRKQAEGLVKDHVPPECISFVATQSVGSEQKCQQIVFKLGLNKQLTVRRVPDFFYNLTP